MKTALITGASTGIGKELAHEFAKGGHKLVLIARSEDLLHQLAAELKQRYGTESTVLVQDLSLPDAANSVYNFTQQAGIQIDVLANNAGYGDLGSFHERPLDKLVSMIGLNVTTLTALTHLYLQGMLARRQGHILNVASMVGFMPGGAYMAVYYATKAFVVSFSEGIAVELKGTGVSVTTLCPGLTHSGFQSAAEMGNVRLFKMMPTSTSEKVAWFGYRAFLKKRLIAIPGFNNKFTVFSNRILPRNANRAIVKFLQDPKSRK